jgi:hypothetical protein
VVTAALQRRSSSSMARIRQASPATIEPPNPASFAAEWCTASMTPGAGPRPSRAARVPEASVYVARSTVTHPNLRSRLATGGSSAAAQLAAGAIPARRAVMVTLL